MDPLPVAACQRRGGRSCCRPGSAAELWTWWWKSGKCLDKRPPGLAMNLRYRRANLRKPSDLPPKKVVLGFARAILNFEFLPTTIQQQSSEEDPDCGLLPNASTSIGDQPLQKFSPCHGFGFLRRTSEDQRKSTLLSLRLSFLIPEAASVEIDGTWRIGLWECGWRKLPKNERLIHLSCAQYAIPLKVCAHMARHKTQRGTCTTAMHTLLLL